MVWCGKLKKYKEVKMSNNKQSSVKMLWMEIDNLIPYTNERDSQLFRDLLEKYEAIHKEEMVKFALFFSHAQVSRTNVIDEYNETFNNDGNTNN